MSIGEQLRKAVKTKELCSIFEASDLEGGYTGIVKRVTEDEILLHQVERDGTDGGYQVRRLENIICCSMGGSELKRRKTLWQEHEHREIYFPAKRDSMIADILAYAAAHAEPVGLICQGVGYGGWIISFSDDMVILKELASCGEEEGVVWLRRDWIDAIQIQSPELLIRAKLSKTEPKKGEEKREDFYHKLQRYAGKEHLFEFYNRPDDPGHYCVGMVEYLTGEEIMIKNIDMQGRYNGHSVLLLDHIFCIYQKSKYLSKMRFIQKCDLSQNGLCLKGECLSEELLTYAYENDLLITLTIDDKEYDGKVVDWDSEQIVLDTRDSFGSNEERIWILRYWVTSLWIENSNLRHLKMIEKNREGQSKL